jgi:phospholipid/cholesterol/gamma-HCH transport system ATP-binding protein
MLSKSAHTQHKPIDPTDETIVQIRDLYKAFDDRPVLRGVNLDLYPSENLVIIGKSGTGKSVLIKCMVGLITPDSGSIKIFGQEVTDLPPASLDQLRLKIGFSFQGSALYDSMSVRKNLEFPLRRNLGITDEDELDHYVISALEDVGLASAIDKMPSDLSGGMKKRIGIARTLILNPSIMLYDEPTSGLDPITSREINELINEVRIKHNTASIIITHDISCARTTGDRLVALMDGINKVEGTFEELQRATDEEVKAFFNY